MRLQPLVLQHMRLQAAKGLEVPGLTGLLESYDGEPAAHLEPSPGP